MKTTEPLTTKVTYINGRYHCRLFKDGRIHSESIVKSKDLIGPCFRNMLRWYDKGGYPYSKMADSSRHRGKI